MGSRIVWVTKPTVHYQNVSGTWVTVEFETDQAAHDYYKRLVTQWHMTARIVDGKVKYRERRGTVIEIYQTLKQAYPQHILLLRKGDFYEAFGEDAKQLTRVWNNTLSSWWHRGEHIPWAGIPYTSRHEVHLALNQAGYAVALVDYVIEADPIAGPVPRRAAKGHKPYAHLNEVTL